MECPTFCWEKVFLWNTLTLSPAMCWSQYILFQGKPVYSPLPHIHRGSCHVLFSFLQLHIDQLRRMADVYGLWAKRFFIWWTRFRGRASFLQSNQYLRMGRVCTEVCFLKQKIDQLQRMAIGKCIYEAWSKRCISSTKRWNIHFFFSNSKDRQGSEEVFNFWSSRSINNTWESYASARMSVLLMQR